MKLPRRLLLALLFLALLASLFVLQRDRAVSIFAASYTGVARLNTPTLALDLSVSPPVGTPGDTLQLTATLRNEGPATAQPDLLFDLPHTLGANRTRLPAGVTFNLEEHSLRWLPVLQPGTTAKLDLALKVETADLMRPEQRLSVLLREPETTHTATAVLWIGLPPRIDKVLDRTHVAVGQPVQLAAGVTGPGPFVQEWRLGDGRRVEVTNPEVVYATAGVYDVKLEVRNPLGTVSRTAQLTVVPHAAAQFRPQDETPGVGQAVGFINQSGGQGPLRHTWDFGDGTTSSESQPQHVYQSPGTYQVRLVSENQFGRSETTQTVTVGVPPAAQLAMNDSAQAGDPILAEAAGDSSTVEYAWDFGDGRAKKGPKVSHAFRQTGDYYVTVTASNEFGSTQVGRWIHVDPGMLKIFMPVVGNVTQGQNAVGPASLQDELGIELEPVPLDGTFLLEPIEIAPDTTPAEALFIYINEARRQFNLAPLRYVYELSTAAQAHADDMARANHTRHMGSDGSFPAERLLWHRYRQAYAGEATAWGFREPREAVEFWINSPGHRAIILNQYASDLGVGHTLDYNAASGWYWVAEFGNGFGSPDAAALRLQSPINGQQSLNTDAITFSWNWPLPLAADEQFVISLQGEEGAQTVATVSAPIRGTRYAVSVTPADFGSLSGDFTWQLSLQSTGGAVRVASEARALTVAPDPSLPTPTPPATAVPTALPTTVPLPTATPTPTPQPTTEVAPPSATELPPPIIITATPVSD